MGPAAQGEFIDIGLPALRVVALSVVGLAAVPAGGAPGAGAATIAREQHEPLPDRGNPLTTRDTAARSNVCRTPPGSGGRGRPAGSDRESAVWCRWR